MIPGVCFGQFNESCLCAPRLVRGDYSAESHDADDDEELFRAFIDEYGRWTNIRRHRLLLKDIIVVPALLTTQYIQHVQS